MANPHFRSALGKVFGKRERVGIATSRQLLTHVVVDMLDIEQDKVGVI